MELTLTTAELEVLKALLDVDYSRIIREIARTDTRKMRDELKDREELIKSIMAKLGVPVRKVA